MPNWSNNAVAVKGKKENVLNFINEGLKNSNIEPQKDIEKAFDEETNSKLKPLKFCQDGKILKIRCTGKGENKKYTLYKLENFVQILLDNYSAKKNLIDESAYGWLITILEINAEVDDVEMIDITKYLIYKANK